MTREIPHLDDPDALNHGAVLRLPSHPLLSLLGLSASELQRSVRVAVSYALLLAALYVLKPARNALFLEVVGVEYLPHGLLAVAVVGTLLAFVMVRLSFRLTLEKAVPRLLLLGGLFFCVVLVVFELRSKATVFTFYVAVHLFGQLATSLVWLWANASFDTREARRVFSFIAALGILGAFLGGMSTLALVELVGTRRLVLLAVALCVASGTLLLRAEGPSRARREMSKPATGLFEDVKRSSLVRLLLSSTVIAAAVSALVDLQFNLVVDQSLVEQDGKTAFFGGFFALLNAGAFLFQLLISSRLIARVGLGASLLLLPLSVTLGSAFVLLFPVLQAAVALKSADVGLRHSLYRSVVEVLFVPLPSSMRRRARVLLDATFDNLGTGVGACVGLFLVQGSWFALSSVSVAALALSLVWLALVVRLRPAYVSALRLRLLRRELHPDELHVEISDRTQRSVLLESLSSQSPRQLHYALDALCDVRSDELLPQLRRLLSNRDAAIRKKALALLASQPRSRVLDDAEALLRDPDPSVAREALVVLALKADDPEDTLRAYLADRDPLRWAAAFAAIADRLGNEGRQLLSPEVRRRVRDAIGDAAVAARAELVRALASLSDSGHVGAILELQCDDEPDVMRQIIAALGRLGGEAELTWLLARLDDRRYRALATQALAAVGTRAIPELGRRLRSGGVDRHVLSRVLRQIGKPEAAGCLFQVAMELPVPERGPLLAACAQLRFRDAGLSFPLTGLNLLLRAEARWQLSLLEAGAALDGMPSGASPHAALLGRALFEKRLESVERMLHCLTLVYSPADIRGAQLALRSRNRRVRARALELLDEVLVPEHQRLVLPLLEGSPSALSQDLGIQSSIPKRQETWRWLLEQSDDWLRACALFAFVDRLAADPDGVVQRLSQSRDPVVEESARWVLERLRARVSPL